MQPEESSKKGRLDEMYVSINRLSHFLELVSSDTEIEEWGEESFYEFGSTMAATLTPIGDRLKFFPFWGVGGGQDASGKRRTVLWGGSHSGLKSGNPQSKSYLTSSARLFDRVSQISYHACTSEFMPKNLCQIIGNLTSALAVIFADTEVLERLKVSDVISRHGIIHSGKSYYSRYSALCLGWVLLALYIILDEMNVDLASIETSAPQIAVVGRKDFASSR